MSDVSNKEQVSIVIRFVDSSNCIHEEFLDFILTKRVTGEVLAYNIKDTLTKYGLDFKNCRGQGYDGASNMSAQNCPINMYVLLLCMILFNSRVSSTSFNML